MQRYNYGTITLIAAFLISAPKGFAQKAEPTRFTVKPNAPSAITMKTIPNADCVLHAEGATDVHHKLFADSDGMIRFFITPGAESEQPAHFQVDCTADGKVSTFPLHLRSNSYPTSDMPAPVAETPKLRPEAYVRAALTEDETLHLSDEDLAVRGYPTRPDPEQEPAAFATWKRAVTKPSTFVPPRLAANPEATHRARLVTDALGSSSNWSGFALVDSSKNFFMVSGSWYVPAVQPERLASTKTVYSSFWIGLDGMNSGPDLVQDGTEQQVTDYVFTLCIPFAGCQGIHYDVTSYYAWSEIWPLEPEEAIAGFTVNPGDEILTSVSKSATSTGTTANFFIDNLTRSEYTVLPPRATDSNTSVGSFTAEWIMERPTVNNVLPDLADYGFAYMYSATARRSAQWRYPVCYECSNNEQIRMFNGSDLLSTVYPVSNTEMEFIWINFH
jgi:hypothetical protein